MVAQTEEPLVVITRHKHGVTELRLNRPRYRNAFSRKLYSLTTHHLNNLSADAQTRIILLTATGETFSSGMDIKEASTAHIARATINAAKEFMKALLNTPKIVVAAVSGPVVGIGVTLLLHCDFVYAASSTTFATPFPSVGLVPEFGASVTFPLWLGYRRSHELLLMAKTLSVSDLGDIVTPVHGGRNAVVAHARRACDEWSKGLGEEEWRAVELGKARIRARIREVVTGVLEDEIGMIENLVDAGVTERLMSAKRSRMAKM